MICQGCYNLIQPDGTALEFSEFVLLLGVPAWMHAHNDLKCLAEAAVAELIPKHTDEICHGCGLEINSDDLDYLGYLQFKHNGRVMITHYDQECLEKALNVRRIDEYRKASGW